MVRDRDGGVGPPDPASGQPQPLKRLRAGDLVDQMTVNIKHISIIAHLVDDMGGPDLVE
jgi:hypothetical protein